jgi:hypothetical protein
MNNVIGVMVSVLTSSAVDHGFEPRSGWTKDYILLLFMLIKFFDFRVKTMFTIAKCDL